MPTIPSRFIFLGILLAASPLVQALNQPFLGMYNQISLQTNVKYTSVGSQKRGVPGVGIAGVKQLNRLVFGGKVLVYHNNDKSITLSSHRGFSSRTHVQLDSHLGWLADASYGFWEPFIEMGWQFQHQTSVPKIIYDDNHHPLPSNGYSEVHTHYYVVSGLAFSTAMSERLVGRFSVSAGKRVRPTIEYDLPADLPGIRTLRVRYHPASSLLTGADIQLGYRVTARTSMGFNIAYKHVYYKKAYGSIHLLRKKSNRSELCAGLSLNYTFT